MIVDIENNNFIFFSVSYENFFFKQGTYSNFYDFTDSS